MKLIKTLLPHITLILSIMFIVFLILDNYNPMMNFVDNSISQVLLYILCASGTINSVVTIVKSRRPDKSKGSL